MYRRCLHGVKNISFKEEGVKKCNVIFSRALMTFMLVSGSAQHIYAEEIAVNHSLYTGAISPSYSEGTLYIRGALYASPCDLSEVDIKKSKEMLSMIFTDCGYGKFHDVSTKSGYLSLNISINDGVLGTKKIHLKDGDNKFVYPLDSFLHIKDESHLLHQDDSLLKISMAYD